jgi:hypothetical protein
MSARRIYIISFIVFGLCGCESQLIKETKLCYNVIGNTDLKTGDTLCIFNCSQSGYAWLGLARDTNSFNHEFTTYPVGKDNYWHIELKDTGKFYCRISVGYLTYYAETKSTTFTVQVAEKKFD